jgi:hypothetical protein
MANIPLPSAYGKGESLRFDASRLVNFEAIPASGQTARSAFYLTSSPGLKRFSTLGTGLYTTRGLMQMGGVLYAVNGTSLYRVDQFGVETSLGTVAGSLPVTIAKIGRELVICADTLSYVWNAQTSTFSTITDPDFYVADAVTAQNQRVIFNRRGTGQFFWSDTLAATVYDGLNLQTAEANDDNLVAPFAAYDDLWLFGQETIEVAREAVDGFYDRISGAVLDVGLASKMAVTRLGNAVYWLGHDGVVYGAAGYSPQPISTFAISDEIASLSRITDAIMWGYSTNGHKYIVLTFPFAQRTFVYDVGVGSWHERSSYGVGQWRGLNYAYCYGKHIVGALNEGGLYEIRRDVYDEDGTEIRRIIDMGFIADGVNSFTIDRVELVLDTGLGGTATGTDTDPIVSLSWSNDGGRTFSTPLQASAGLLGNYQQKVVWRRLGQFHMDAMLRVEVSSKTPWRIVAADAILEGRGV